jgi:NADH-quinone oxidoreductase subunit N
MNWLVLLPEAWLLLAACVITLADLFVTGRDRGPTYGMTQLAVAVFSALHLSAFADGTTAYGLGGMVVTDPMGHLLAFFAGGSTMVTLAYARPTLLARDMPRASSTPWPCSCCWASR